MKKVLNFLIIFFCKITNATENHDIFHQNIGEKMEIGITDTGYKNVELKCGAESMTVLLETDEDFFGVIYTRGNYYDKKLPCFYDSGSTTGQTSFKMNIPFDKCNTKKENNTYSNILILQHDKELIMPGDAAFNLECDFSKPRDVVLTADFISEDAMASRITLVDADPAKEVKTSNKIGTFESYTSSVIITPEILKRRKEEL